MRARGSFRRGLVRILTWSGLRGDISIALALALPRFPGKEILLASTYAVVVFSVLVQGLTVRRVLSHYGVRRLDGFEAPTQEACQVTTEFGRGPGTALVRELADNAVPRSQ